MAVAVLDVVIYSLAAFLGNVGVAVTGFGMAIVFFLVWEIATLVAADWVSDFKYAVFIQAIGLFAAQPLLLYQANIRQHGTRALLMLFLPVTVLSTPLGQLLSSYVPVDTVQAVGGVVISVFAAFEIYRNRALIKEACGCKASQEGPGHKEKREEAADEQPKDTEDDDEGLPCDLPCVFFMIGSQRSGSNWLRTMLGEREELAGPHPPHIFENFMPLLTKFGDLREDSALEIFVDHVCTFVERNQVPWMDKHGRCLRFDRKEVIQAVKRWTDTEGHDTGPDFLVAIFDKVYTTHALSNGKTTWICKSMGMSKYHDILMRFYGFERLRYVYLIRDPRDVAMSFMKTPVGDCHYHTIATKWCKNQELACDILNETRDLVHVLHYEDLLKDRQKVMGDLYEFLGAQMFARECSTSSVVNFRDLQTRLEDANTGDEAVTAAKLSSQFGNLVKGPEFAAKQNQKWLTGDPPLGQEELTIVESVVWRTMQRLGYEPAIITKTMEPVVYSDEQLAEFARLNAEGIKKMNENLMEEDPGDAKRRIYQAEVLSLPATLIPYSPKDEETLHPMEQLKSHREAERDTIDLPDGYRISIAAMTQKGYHPKKKGQVNQDAFRVRRDFGGSGKHWLAVYDGHGPAGAECSQFARQHVPDQFLTSLRGDDIFGALAKAHTTVDTMLAQEADIDDAKSGTTAITVYMDGLRCYISNIGDSRCFMGSVGPEGRLVTAALSEDQTPFRRDERERVKKCGAVVMTLSQSDGVEPLHEEWLADEGAAPRVWKKGEKYPGTAFTRSVGDSLATSLGVVAEPEFKEVIINDKDRVLLVASDGVTQYLSNSMCCELVLQHSDPLEACSALVDAACQRWSDMEDRVDDITAIVGFIEPPGFDGNRGFRRLSTASGESKQAAEELAKSAAEAQEPPREYLAPGLGLKLWAVSMGFASGFLGGLCGIRGPPIILFFLHLTCPKAVQKANGSAITLVNISMRIVYYAFESAQGADISFRASDWPLYTAVVLVSPIGVWVGGKLFQLMKDTQAKIKTLLAFLLVLCGISLLINTFS